MSLEAFCIYDPMYSGSFKLIFVSVYAVSLFSLSYCEVAINRCCLPGQIYQGNACYHLTTNKTVESNFNATTEYFHTYQWADQRVASQYLELSPSSVIAVPAQLNHSAYRYRLRHHLPHEECADGSFLVHLVIDAKMADNVTKLTSRGELKVNSEYYSSPEYCIVDFNSEVITFRVCKATCNGRVPCIRKCCDLDEGWSRTRGFAGCQPAGDLIWTPEFYDTATKKASAEKVSSLYPHYIIVNPKEWCKRSNVTTGLTVPHRRNLAGYLKWTFRIGIDGSLYRRMSRYTWAISDSLRETSCFDGGISWITTPGGVNQSTYSGLREDEIIFECTQKKSSTPKTQGYLYGVLMIVSCSFLLLTILVHFLLWNKQTVHGWTLMSYCCSLFLMYLFFAVNNFSVGYLRRRPDGKIGSYCEFIGISANFFFLFTFCWMTVINFDLWLTFKKLKPPIGRSRGFKRYLTYTAFAVSIPVAIISVAVILDSLYGDDPESGVIVPHYARKSCLPDREYAQLLYQHGPAGVLLIFNIVFFIGTVFSIRKAQQKSKFASSNSSKNSQQRSSLRLFTKLLFATGIPWIFEIISMFAERKNPNGNSWYWLLFDLVNILQGVVIFFIFVFKRDILQSLGQTYPGLKNHFLIEQKTAERIRKNFPSMKVIVGPLTKGADPTSTSSGNTESCGVQNSTTSADSEAMQISQTSPSSVTAA